MSRSNTRELFDKFDPVLYMVVRGCELLVAILYRLRRESYNKNKCSMLSFKYLLVGLDVFVAILK